MNKGDDALFPSDRQEDVSRMKITISADWPLASSTSETIFPLVSGSLNSGAVVLSGSMVEGVRAMRGI
jgi:hypothetical protein